MHRGSKPTYVYMCRHARMSARNETRVGSILALLVVVGVEQPVAVVFPARG
jgi:hypothetical protein